MLQPHLEHNFNAICCVPPSVLLKEDLFRSDEEENHPTQQVSYGQGVPLKLLKTLNVENTLWNSERSMNSRFVFPFQVQDGDRELSKVVACNVAKERAPCKL